MNSWNELGRDILAKADAIVSSADRAALDTVSYLADAIQAGRDMVASAWTRLLRTVRGKR